MSWKGRKYWDEDYVHHLEKQVETLLEALRESEKQRVCSVCRNNPSIIDDAPLLAESVPAVEMDEMISMMPGSDRAALMKQDLKTYQGSSEAMEELSVMMWRTNLGDGASFTHERHEPLTDLHERVKDAHLQPIHPIPPQEIVCYSRDTAFLEDICNAFLDSINKEHQFTTYDSPSLIHGYPLQPLDDVFLHTAILAVGASFLGARDKQMEQASEVFARYAETLLFDCCRLNPSLAAVQGAAMLSFRSLALGRDHMGWAFISIAGGLCVHLRLHVLALDGISVKPLQPSVAEIRTFWMYYFVDRSAITILGRNCALPWRRFKVPMLDTTFELGSAELDQVSFAWQCRLWYMHDGALDQIFSSSFDSLPSPQRVALLVLTLENLNNFFAKRPQQLYMSRITPTPVILFHLQYHMAVLVTISPFLRTFTSRTAPCTDDSPNSSTAQLVLKTISNSASETVRLVRWYRSNHGFQAAHPIILHHLLSAGLVHLMNATSSSTIMQKKSSQGLHACMGLLDELRGVWPVRADKSLEAMRSLGEKWGVLRFLPVQFTQNACIIASLTAPGKSSTGTSQIDPSPGEEQRIQGPVTVATVNLLEGLEGLSGFLSSSGQGAMDDIFRGIIGSPDPWGRQLDGLRIGLSSLSKVCVVGLSANPETDVDYTFAAIGVKDPSVDYTAKCGNMTFAVGPFAIDTDTITPTPNERGLVTIQILNTNINKIIHATFPVENGEATARGHFSNDGVHDKTPEIKARLEYIWRKAGVKVGLAEAEDQIPGVIPKIGLVSAPETSTNSNLVIRAISVGQAHRAVPATVALSVAVSAKIEGTVLSECLRGNCDESPLVLAHPTGN
ncbi:Nitrogen assimilation transcription factor nit-4 [Paramyrothecium foliicola]|nr:Nitrogen assimilation transcription factor nit-4 [Paramyrothecium foliicola]